VWIGTAPTPTDVDLAPTNVDLAPTDVDLARNPDVSASIFMQDAHGASETAVPLPDEKRENPLPGWASAKAAIAAAETAAAPTEVACPMRHRLDRPKPSDDHAGATAIDSLSTFANAPASRAQSTHGSQMPR